MIHSLLQSCTLLPDSPAASRIIQRLVAIMRHSGGVRDRFHTPRLKADATPRENKLAPWCSSARFSLRGLVTAWRRLLAEQPPQAKACATRTCATCAALVADLIGFLFSQ